MWLRLMHEISVTEQYLAILKKFNAKSFWQFTLDIDLFVQRKYISDKGFSPSSCNLHENS